MTVPARPEPREATFERTVPERPAPETIEAQFESPEPAPASVSAPVAAPEKTTEPAALPTPPAPEPQLPPPAQYEQAPALPSEVKAPRAEPQPELPEASAWQEPEIAELVEDAARSLEPAEEAAKIALPSDRPSVHGIQLPSTETQTIEDDRRVYVGKRVDLRLVDADIKQVFGHFHEISGLNFVLDPTVNGVVTIVVDNVPWDQALDLILKNNGLDMVLEGNVIRIAPIQKLAQEATARKALFEAKELEKPPVTITRTLSYAKAREIETVVRDAILSPRGRVIVDERTNTLIIRDIPARVQAIDRLLTTLDAETPQVMIEARIVEVSRDYIFDLGIDWGFTASADPAHGTQTNMNFPHRATAEFDLNLPRQADSSSLGFSFGNVLDSFTLDVTLNALENEGYGRRLSQPKIATQNNERAEIEQGVRIPIVSTTATEIDVTFVSATLRMEVTPQITAEGTVVLEVTVENNSADFVNAIGDIPPINTQRAETTVLVADGGTTVIGGIFTINEGRSEIGLPWFRKVPGLKWLFSQRNVQTRNRELLVFITPRIIKAS